MKSFRILILFSATALVTVFAVAAPTDDNSGFQIAVLGLALSGVLAFFTTATNRGHPIWASISFLFTLSYVIVNLNLPILRLFGIDLVPSVERFIWTEKDVYNLSVAVSTLGLLYFLSGVAIAQSRPSTIAPQNRYVYSSEIIPALAMISLVLFLATSGSYALGDYSGIGASSLSSYFYKIFKVSMTAFVLMKVASFFALADQISSFREYLRHLGGLLLFILVIFLTITFIVGDRGPLIFFTLATFGPYWARRNNFGLLRTIVVAYAAAVVLSVLGTVRQARFEGESFFERVSDAISTVSVFYYTSYRFDQPILLGHTLELAASVRILNHVIANVPSEHSFGFGLFSGLQIASVVPGVGGLINRVFFNGDWRMDGSSNFVTYLIQGVSPTYGDGTSATGELYLDFGMFGVAFGLFVFGLAVGRHEFKLYAGPGNITFGWVFAMVYFANALYISRSSLLLELSNTILVFLLLRFAVRRRERGVPHRHGGLKHPHDR